MRKLSLMLLSLFIAGLQIIQAQGVSISGRTTDATTGEALPGVTVQVKGTMTGAISEASGSFRIASVPADATTLVFSFVGYQTQEVEIGGRTVIDVAMEEEITALEEIVVTGYSVERKKDIIGSVAVVNTDEMLTTPSGNVTAQLAGRVAGVSVSSDGALDGSSKVRVRGFGSFASSEPLYIVDGVPSENIDNINPNDIESIQFLKDAASASVYGSRAASGVVVITTKQGQSGPIRVNLDTYYGVNYVNDFPDVLNAEEWGDLIWQSMENAGLAPTHEQYGSGASPVIPEYILAYDMSGQPRGGAYLEALRISNPAEFNWMVDPENYDYATHAIVKSADTDWFDEVFNPAPVTSVQLSASGGSERGTFALALNYFNQEQTSDKYSYFRRYTVRANTTYNVLNVITLGENLQVMYNEGRNVGYPAAAWTMPALLPVWDIGGNPTGGASPGISKTNDGGLGNSPIAAAWHNRFDKYYNFGIFGNVFGEVRFFKDLVVRSSFGLDFNYSQNRNLTQTVYEQAEGNGTPNTLAWSSNDRIAWTWTNTATYSKTLGAHTLKLLLGTEAISQVNSNLSASRQDFVINDDPYFLVPNAGTGEQTNSGSYTPYSLFSYFGRLDYTYGDKYIFNATIRRDGSSKFGKNNRYGNFPSVAVGWRVTGEDFMQNITWLTDLKLRVSYGIVGNQSGLGYDNQFTTFVSTVSESYPIAGGASQITQSYTKDAKGNPDARWEKSTTQNYGFDATMFSGRTSLSLDYYIKETNDLLVRNQQPYTEPNVSQPYVNVGDIRNTGLDIILTQRGRIAGQLDYEVSANFSTYKNEVLKIMDDPAVELYGGNTRAGNACITRVGEEISSFYGYKLDGFIDDQAELDAYNAAIPGGTWLNTWIGGWKLVDQNDDGIINPADRVILGSPHPDFQIGVNLSLAWKGIDFSAFVFWNQGGYLFNDSRYNVDFNTYAYNRSSRMLYDSWRPDHKDAELPQLSWTDSRSALYVTDYFLEKDTYVRIRTMQLGYTIPQRFLNVVKLNRLRVYIQGQNLLTFVNKDFTGLDPGVSLSGSDLGMGVIDNFNPTPKQIIFGLNVGF